MTRYSIDDIFDTGGIKIHFLPWTNFSSIILSQRWCPCKLAFFDACFSSTNKSGPSEFNYEPCVRHFSWCSFVFGSSGAAAQQICVGSGRALLNGKPECLGIARGDVYCELLCLSTLSTFQAPSLQAHLQKSSYARRKLCSSTKV